MGAKVGKIIVFLSATVEVCLLKAGNYGSDIIFFVYIFFVSFLSYYGVGSNAPIQSISM